jgi:hypothetical protein
MENKKKSFFPTDNVMLFNKNISADAKILLAIMYRHKNNAGEVNKSQKELSILTGISKGSIGKCIDELIKNKLLDKKSTSYRGSYIMKYSINLQDGNYTKLIYEMIGEYSNDIIIKFLQLTNLLKINKFDTNPKLYTQIKITQSNWLTVENVIGAMLELTDAGLFSYKYKANAIYDEELNPIEQKEKAQSEDQAQRKDEKNEFTNNIREPQKKIANNIQQVKGFEEEMNTPGTAAYLVKKHTDAFKIPLTPSYARDSINKLQQLIAEYTYLGVEKTINYMIENDTKTLNFIKSVIPTVLAGFDPEYEAQNVAKINLTDMKCILLNYKEEYEILEKLGWTDRPQYKVSKDKFDKYLVEYQEAVKQYKQKFGGN